MNTDSCFTLDLLSIPSEHLHRVLQDKINGHWGLNLPRAFSYKKIRLLAGTCVCIYSRGETKGQRKSWLVGRFIMQTSCHFCTVANTSLAPQWVIISICHLKQLLCSDSAVFFKHRASNHPYIKSHIQQYRHCKSSVALIHFRWQKPFQSCKCAPSCSCQKQKHWQTMTQLKLCLFVAQNLEDVHPYSN